ncbi:hypothetical protein M0805_007964 [Coniferiporia weirii]|nr:hypothetical protein M0805_007964 [Coniferiporia weirii]
MEAQTNDGDGVQSARRKGKLRAIPDSEESSETTPLLGPSNQLIRDDTPSTEFTRQRRRLVVLLSTVFVSALGLCLLLVLSVLAISYSYSTKVSDAVREGALDRALVVQGPERIDVLNATEGSVWLQVDVNVGIDAETAIGAVLEPTGKERNWFGIIEIQKAFGRWAVQQVGQLTVSSGEVSLFSEDKFLANVTAPTISLSLTIGHPNDFSWLTPLSLPVQINVTTNATDLTAFAEESWRTGFMKGRALVSRLSVRGGPEGGNGWRSRLKAKKDHIIVPARLKIPDLPGLPSPGRDTPFPEFSDLVTLKSFNVASVNHTISIRASASVIDPMPPSLSMRIPSIPFFVSLSDANTTRMTTVTVVTGRTYPFSITHPNVSVSVVGTVLPIPRSASPILSTFLSAYLAGLDAPITVGTPLLPTLRIPTVFPGPHPKPRILQDAQIKDMRISLRGESVLASGIVYAHVVLPLGIDVGLDAQRAWPDVLVFDGEVPNDGDDTESSNIINTGLLGPSRNMFSTPSRASEDEEKNGSKGRTHIPKEPLPDPLPPRAFARIRPDDWIPALSKLVPSPDGEPVVYEVYAQVTDVPLEVLPGRDALLRSFITKVLFSGREGALAGVRGTAAVAAAVDGLPVEGDGDDDEDGRAKHVMELMGLPFSGSVRVGRKSL